MKRKIDLSYQQLPKRSCLVIHPDTGTTCNFDHDDHKHAQERAVKIKDAIEKMQKDDVSDEVWRSFDAALQEISDVANPRPPKSFTVAERAAQKGISRGAAARQVKKLLDAGMAKKIGQGNTFYYVMAAK